MKHVLAFAIAAALSFLFGPSWLTGALILITVILVVAWAFNGYMNMLDDFSGNQDDRETLDEILLRFTASYGFFCAVFLVSAITAIAAVLYLIFPILMWIWLGYLTLLAVVAIGCMALKSEKNLAPAPEWLGKIFSLLFFSFFRLLRKLLQGFQYFLDVVEKFLGKKESLLNICGMADDFHHELDDLLNES